MKKSRTTLPLDEQDREAIVAIRDYYGVHSDADAITIALRETLRAIRRQSQPQEPGTAERPFIPRLKDGGFLARSL